MAPQLIALQLETASSNCVPAQAALAARQPPIKATVSLLDMFLAPRLGMESARKC